MWSCWLARVEDMGRVSVLIAITACVAGCDSAPRSYADPERLEWEVERADPISIQVLDRTGNWSLSCPDGVSLMVAGPHKFHGAEGDKVQLSIGQVGLDLRRRVEEAPAFYADGSPTPEAVKAMAQGGAVGLKLDGRTIVLRPIRPELARQFSEACLQARGRYIAGGGWCGAAREQFRGTSLSPKQRPQLEAMLAKRACDLLPGKGSPETD